MFRKVNIYFLKHVHAITINVGIYQSNNVWFVIRGHYLINIYRLFHERRKYNLSFSTYHALEKRYRYRTYKIYINNGATDIFVKAYSLVVRDTFPKRTVAYSISVFPIIG